MILRTHAFLKIKSAYSCWLLVFCCLLGFFSLLNHIFILRDCECFKSRIKLGLVLIESCFPVKKPQDFFFLKSWILTFSDHVLDSAGKLVNVHRCEISFVLLWSFVGTFNRSLFRRKATWLFIYSFFSIMVQWYYSCHNSVSTIYILTCEYSQFCSWKKSCIVFQ